MAECGKGHPYLMKKLITQKSLETFFSGLNIKKGDVILLQANLHDEAIVGSYGALIDSLLNLIGPGGLLIIPSFSMYTMDPASTINDYTLEEYEELRQGNPGFSSKMSIPDRYFPSSAALMLHIKSRRSEHPVYSFCWLGACPYKPSIADLNFPLSYKHVLKVFERPGAINLLIGEPLRDAIYPLLEARKQEKDTLEVLQTYYRKVKRSFPATFLSSVLDDASFNEVLNSFSIQNEKLGSLNVYAITLKEEETSSDNE